MQDFSSLDLFQHIVLTDFLRYFIPAAAAYLAFWVVFKKRWQHRIIQQKPLLARKMWSEFGYSMSTVAIFASIGFCIVSLKNAGFTLIYDDFGQRSITWFFVSIGLMLFLHDAYFYWTHRLMHHPRIFRHVHLVHHRSTHPSPWAAYAFHPIEAVIEAGIFVLIVFTIPAHGLALLSCLIYMVVRNVLGHLGIEFLPPGFLKNRWLNWHTTTTHHDLHHKHFEGNYGLYFTWWDRWLGTERPEYQQVFEEVTSRPQVEDSLEQVSKKSATIGAAIILAAILGANFAAAQSPVGTWQTIDDGDGKPRSRVQIEAAGEGLTGKIVEIYSRPCETPDPVCERCSGDQKNAKIMGMTFLWGFKKSGGEWTGGSVLDPANGQTYRAKIWLEGINVLKIRGYWGFFWRTQTWQRAN